MASFEHRQASWPAQAVILATPTSLLYLQIQDRFKTDSRLIHD